MINLNITNESKKKYIYDCRFNSLYELLRYYGREISPIKLWLLSDSYGFLCCEFSIPDLDVNNIPYMCSSKINAITKALDKLGVKYEKRRLTNSEEDEKIIENLLEQGTPILAAAEERAGAPNPNENEMLNIKGYAYPLIVGYSNDKTKIIVHWTNTDRKEAIMEVDKAQFHKYRGTKCVPYSPDFNCIIITDLGNLHTLTDKQIDQMCFESIINAAHRMLCSFPADQEFIDAMCTQTVYTGLQGVDYMFFTLSVIIKKVLLPHRDKTIDEMAQFIFALTKTNMISGSYSAYRQEFGAVLKRYAEIYNVKSWQKSAQMILRAAKHWQTLSFTCYKLQNGVQDKILLITLLFALQRIKHWEHKMYRGLLYEGELKI